MAITPIVVAAASTVSLKCQSKFISLWFWTRTRIDNAKWYIDKRMKDTKFCHHGSEVRVQTAPRGEFYFGARDLPFFLSQDVRLLFYFMAVSVNIYSAAGLNIDHCMAPRKARFREIIVSQGEWQRTPMWRDVLVATIQSFFCILRSDRGYYSMRQ